MKKIWYGVFFVFLIFLSGCSLIGLNKIKIEFDSTGGSAVDSIKVEPGDTFTYPQNPTKSGYVFFGWYFDNGTFEESLSEDSFIGLEGSGGINKITVYAKWVDEVLASTYFTVSFDTNGGNTIPDTSVLYGNAPNMPSDPTQTGLEFFGWYSDSDLIDYYESGDPITEDTTLYVDWGTEGLEYTMGNYGIEVSKGTIGNVSTVMIPNLYLGRKVLRVANDGFNGSASIETIIFPNTFKNYDNWISRFDYPVKEYIVREGNHDFKSIDGILFSKDLSTLILYPDKKADTYYEVPSETIEIGSNSFENNKFLEEILISSNVEIIYWQAFMYSESLKKVNFEDNSVLTEIKWNAFSYIPTLENVLIPASVTTIEDYVFENSPNVVIYAEALTQLSNWDVNWNYELSSYGIEEHTVVWGYLRDGSTSDFDYIITSNDTAIITGYNPTSLTTNLVIPESIENKPVTRILRYAFDGESAIEEITFPNSLKYIERYAFRQASSLEKVHFNDSPQLEIIELGAFEYTNLTVFDFPSSLTTIGEFAFMRCPLTTIIIPDTITSIGYYAFYSDTYHPIYVELNSKPSGWVENWYGDEIRPFWGYQGIAEIDDILYVKIANNMAYVLGFADNASTTDVTIVSSVEGHDVIGIQREAFKGNLQITSIRIPATVEIIEESAFENAKILKSVLFESNSNLKEIGKFAFLQANLLENFLIPDGVTTIRDSAFLSNYNVQYFYIPDSVITMGKSVFRNNYGRAFFIGASSKPVGWDDAWITPDIQNFGNPLFWGSNGFGETGTFKYAILSDNTLSILGLVSGSTSTDIVIPETIDNKTVTRIEVAAFLNNRSLNSVIIPDSLLSIGDYAFRGATSLRTISISPNSQLASIGKRAFRYSNIANIYIPNSVTYISEEAFMDMFILFEIHAAAQSLPSTWNSLWNSENYTVIWSYTP